MKEVSNKNGNIFQRLANAFFSERADPIPPNSPDDDAWLGKPLNSRLEDFMDCRRGRRQEDPPQPPSGILTNKNKTHMDRYCDQPKEYNIDPKISTLQARQESAVYSSVSSSSIRSDREPGLVSRNNSRYGRRPAAAAMASHRHTTTPEYWHTTPRTDGISSVCDETLDTMPAGAGEAKVRNAPRLDDLTSPTHRENCCPSQQQKPLCDESIRSEDEEDGNARGRDTEATSNLSRALMTFQQAGTLKGSASSDSTLGMFSAKSAQNSKICQDKSPSTSHLGSSCDSKSTLGIISTGTAKDATRRNVPRLGRLQVKDRTSTIGTQHDLTVRKDQGQTGTSGSQNNFQDSEFSDFFMSQSTGSLRDGHQRHVPTSSDKSGSKLNALKANRDDHGTSDLLQRYLQNKRGHRSGSSPAYPTQRRDGRRPSGKKSPYAKRNNSVEDHVQTITVTNKGTVDRRVSDITMFDNDWDDKLSTDDLVEVHR
ncbi:hypothetical protein THAOC_21115 [Thalassiosira oceanica]|uniref:Uncharacterized protein n=1 Tax=Thalassiosira oceanica TaxID=159749 RepID=K0S0C2_THAOC|nr:hypothetical protein THAOC_21115 [Thalassiosira oceanica]|eukprot:EJK58730.1 hypothetical protein THAOC_21115 [Thalassiosira oceanica]